MGISKTECFEDHFFHLEWAVSDYDGTLKITVDGRHPAPPEMYKTCK